MYDMKEDAVFLYYIDYSEPVIIEDDIARIEYLAAACCIERRFFADDTAAVALGKTESIFKELCPKAAVRTGRVLNGSPDKAKLVEWAKSVLR